MKYKKLYKVLKNFDINRIDELENEIEEAFKDSYRDLSGWSYRLILDKNDNLELIGPMGNNSMTMAEYNGEETTIGFIDCGREYGEILTWFDVDFLEDKDEFLKYVMEQEDITDIEDLDGTINYEYHYSEFNPESYKEVKREAEDRDYSFFEMQFIEDIGDSIIRSIEDIEILEYEREREL